VSSRRGVRETVCATGWPRCCDAAAAGALTCSEEIGGPAQVVGGRGEQGPAVGIGQTSLPHPPEAVQPFPGPEETFSTRAHTRWIARIRSASQRAASRYDAGSDPAHHARLHQCAGLHLLGPAQQLGGNQVEQDLIQTVLQQLPAKPHEHRPLWRPLGTRNTAEPTERPPVLQRFRKPDVLQTVQDRQQQRPEQFQRWPVCLTPRYRIHHQQPRLERRPDGQIGNLV